MFGLCLGGAGFAIVRGTRTGGIAEDREIEKGVRIDGVKSLDDALKFYRDQLGLDVSLRETVAQENVNVAMLPQGDLSWSMRLVSGADLGAAYRRAAGRRSNRQPGRHRYSVQQ